MINWKRRFLQSLKYGRYYWCRLRARRESYITLLLADVFENFKNMCLKIYELDPSKILLGPGLAWQGSLKKTKVKLVLLTYIDILLMVEKGIRGGICHSFYRYAKADNKYMKNFDKNKESLYI